MVIKRIATIVLGSALLAVPIHGTAVDLQPFYRMDFGLISRGGAGDVKKLFRRNDDRMPSLFSQEEKLYDKYAAGLAATEGLRRLRDKALLESSTDDYGDAAVVEEEINEEYAVNAGRVLRALGMTVSQFNQLGKEISHNEELKNKVMEQAYLYRLASTVDMDKASLEDDMEPALGPDFRREKVQSFCKAVTDIEYLRNHQMRRLQKSLHVDQIPPKLNISDPAVLPFLSPRVRAVVEAFPLQAEDIVKKYGLEVEEFNAMMHETRTNPIFRWKVQSQVKTPQSGRKSEAKRRTKPEW